MHAQISIGILGMLAMGGGGLGLFFLLIGGAAVGSSGSGLASLTVGTVAISLLGLNEGFRTPKCLIH